MHARNCPLLSYNAPPAPLRQFPARIMVSYIHFYFINSFIHPLPFLPFLPEPEIYEFCF